MAIPDFFDPELPYNASTLAPKEPDYMTTFHEWKANPSPATRSSVLKAVDPIISGAIRNYGSSPTLKGQAKLLTLKALDTYDPGKGNLKNHLVSHLSGLQRVAAKNDQIIGIPERIAIDQSAIRHAETELENELGRAPNDMEIADHTGISLKRLGHIRNAKPGINSSRFVDEKGDIFSPASTRPDDDPNDDIWQTMVYYDLNNTDKLIMEHSLGLRGKQVLENRELARILGITPGAVSQRRSRIQAMLDERYTHSVFGE